ncbi:MAG: hypothetical protein M1825_004982 [Sarcosagium campestre]|nr:MAG: hypothetical protein M1825_004982 [Sarcosagium campestre]
MARPKQEEENEYEAQRAANIAKNQALLRELQLNAARAGLGPTAGAAKSSARSSTGSTAPKRKKPVVKKEAEDFTPRRTSSRLAGLVADSEVAKRKAEEEYTAIQQAAKVKRQRVSGDLDLSDIVVAGKQWDKSENFLVDVVKGGGNKYEKTFTEDDIKQTGDKELRALRERMSSLELYEGFEPNRIKITPERIYSLGFHPYPDKPVVFAGDKMGNLGIFDASQSADPPPDEDDEDADLPEPNVTAFKLHSRTISAFLVSKSSTTLLSASYDSSIRSLDLTASKATEIYAPDSPDIDEPISGLDASPTSPSTLYFTTLNGLFGRHDTRGPADNSGGTETYQLSDKKIGGFSLHPLHPHLAATASLDRMLKVWDLRKFSGRGESRLPALLGQHESRLSVSHAAWNAAGQVATASYDDTVKIHDFAGCGLWGVGHEIDDDAMSPATVVRHNNQTGRWVTILRAQWQQQPHDGIQKFCIGNMNRYVDIYTADGEQLAQLGGEGITAVPAVAQFHPTADWVAAGTASGKLCLWK